MPSLAPGLALRAACTGLLLLLNTGPALADEAQRLYTRALAATCAQCHGTDGQAVAGQATVRLAGMPERYLLEQLTAFRNGQRPATVMHQITRGYSQVQLESLAHYFGARQ